MTYYRPTISDCEHFDDKGYLLIPELFTAAEAEQLRVTAHADESLKSRATTRSDAQGGSTTLALANELGDGLYARIVRSRRVAESMATFLRDEVYHYHHKMMLKEPFVGGAWEWHQDYGYWYNYGCLYPTMGSCFIAVDRATRANGCLQVIPGSHHLGRIDHGQVGGQTGADAQRVAAVLERLPLAYVEMEPGDGLFFHGNLLHRSDQNTSPDPRWALICCYNTRRNDPYKQSRHPNYTPLDLLDDEAVFATGP
ncbi:MAG: phytanoyl-CoA dioxygenase family protein [Pirellulaceae bacterium]|nr:phytanoyl-CoA dioxygenase family protein [Pirellulaceae bacterium]